MKSITTKTHTLRKAVATSVVVTHPDSIQQLVRNELPKKDVLAVARVAGVAAAKKCPDLIPYCHSLPLDVVTIDYETQEDRIVITASAEAIWKTGVEVEALTAASVAALTIYDMLKPLDREIEIVSTKLVSKRGGKSDYKDKAPKDFLAAIIVTSDGTHQGKRQDRSGKVIQERLVNFGIQSSYDILPDEEDLIVAKLNELCNKKVRLILTTGGTGLGPRDVTVEATRRIMDREIPGIMETARAYGQSRTPYAMLSRGLAAQKGETIIINLPGSSKGTEETLNAIFPWILHSYGMMQGAGH